VTSPLRVLVPRGGAWGERASELLRQYEAQSVVVPLIETVPALENPEFVAAVAGLARGEWDVLALTSAAAVEALVAAAATLSPHTRVAAVGENTALAAAAGGYPVWFTPAGPASQATLARELSEALAGEGAVRILLVQSDLAEPHLAEQLAQGGHAVTRVTGYRTVALEPSPEQLAHLSAATPQGALVTSGSVARGLVPLLRALRLAPAQVALAAIGPETATVLAQLGWPAAIVGSAPALDTLVGELVAHLRPHPAAATILPTPARKDALA
jgi:uroporphyrinogen-III synthase